MKKNIFVELTPEGDVKQVFWSAEDVENRYNSGVVARIYKVFKREARYGTTIKGSLWAKLPEDTKQSQIMYKAQEQVKDLVLRNRMRELSERNLKKDMSKNDIEELLHITKQHLK